MFIGHFGVAFAARRAAPAVALGWLMRAAQFVDLLWPCLLMLGLERMRIAPGTTAVTPLAFEHYPWSHSLARVLLWAAAGGGLWLWLRKERRGALVLALLVLSHWLLDAIVHAPDLPLAPGGSARIGLGLWNSVVASQALEPTKVTSRPSSTQATPSASTTRQCQRDHGRRSRRAGMSVATKLMR